MEEVEIGKKPVPEKAGLSADEIVKFLKVALSMKGCGLISDWHLNDVSSDDLSSVHEALEELVADTRIKSMVVEVYDPIRYTAIKREDLPREPIKRGIYHIYRSYMEATDPAGDKSLSRREIEKVLNTFNNLCRRKKVTPIGFTFSACNSQRVQEICRERYLKITSRSREKKELEVFWIDQ